MNFLKALLLFLMLILIANCSNRNEDEAHILPEKCETESKGLTITDKDSKTEFCLITKEELNIVAWRRSEDGSMFAYASQDILIVQPTSNREQPQSQTSINWYITDGYGENVRRFPLADNKGLRFSPDGQYVIVQEYCFKTRCVYSVYKFENNYKVHNVCDYKTEGVWVWESDCPKFILANNQIWDIKQEYKESGCAYYKENDWSIPACETPTPVAPTVP